ncbi:hypothetical protein DB88DRAFT_127409 [Papiliotrema laurentii]|uniref:Uncharacterized protein n=1 Tax=Papiliotrema laurentii TaxID=5418 RepID=A0AAD9CRT7_PAPLA|nr:hypothetical protein DB88DRAFT_129675 [Papiliotrema laurentii]KAK1920706.1 hypothetical protein DB88DRAFT_127409 [Papiliotrema laurentii]
MLQRSYARHKSSSKIWIQHIHTRCYSRSRSNTPPLPASSSCLSDLVSPIHLHPMRTEQCRFIAGHRLDRTGNSTRFSVFVLVLILLHLDQVRLYASSTTHNRSPLPPIPRLEPLDPLFLSISSPPIALPSLLLWPLSLFPFPRRRTCVA